MKITRIYVERLKSYGDYSNRRVGLEAVLDGDENVEEVYTKLASLAETLLDKQEIQAKREAVEEEMKRYQERIEELEKVRDEYVKIREELTSELNRLAEEISKIEKLVEEKQLKLKDSILEKLRKIRHAVEFWSDPYDP